MRGGRKAPHLALRILRSDRERWLDRWRPGDRYRLEAEIERGRPVVRSYHFALCPGRARSRWRVAVVRTAEEPVDRVLDNAVRYVVARCAVEEGGLALHAAGVVRDGRAYVFAGPSRSGKTTVVALSGEATSLGDDFAVLLRRDEKGWLTPAVPFDNSERAPAKPPRGLFPVAGIWRLLQASEDRVEELPGPQATASLTGCAAFLWAMPDLASAVLEHAGRFLSESRFAHLHFRRTPGFWQLISR